MPAAQPEPPLRKPNWVTLTTCRDIVEADLLKIQLESKGIPAFVPDQFISQTFALNPNAFGFVRVQVAGTSVEAAKQILASFQKPASQDERATVPLSWAMKLVAAFLPVVALTIAGFAVFAFIKGSYTAKGYDRKATQMRNWFLGGAAFWFIAFIVLLSVMQNRPGH
jgi:hypothetical protein